MDEQIEQRFHEHFFDSIESDPCIADWDNTTENIIDFYLHYIYEQLKCMHHRKRNAEYNQKYRDDKKESAREPHRAEQSEKY